MKAYEDLPREAIKIIVNGQEKEGVSFKTTPFDVAEMFDKKKAKGLLVAKVRYPDGVVATLDEGISTPIPSEDEVAVADNDAWKWHDATRPFEGNVEVKLFYFEDSEGKETFWHSSAHVLGETMETEFGVHLCHGPPTEDGFFYDSYTGGKDGDKFTDAHYKEIEKAA